MANSEGRARHLSRRSSILEGIPAHINIPKFMTREEIDAMKKLKAEQPSLDWDEARDAIIRESRSGED